MSDFLIRNARIVDGTGAPDFNADVRVETGRITAIGDSLPASGTVVDADGRYLAPGFIDAHCHDDLICLREPERIEKIMQGVTSLVVGNCSFSLYPTVPDSADNLRQHFATLLGEISADEVFDSFSSYRDALQGRSSPRPTRPRPKDSGIASREVNDGPSQCDRSDQGE